MFNNNLIYDSDPAALFYKSIEKKNDPNCINYIKELMQEVKDNHTFISRINTIYSVL